MGCGFAGRANLATEGLSQGQGGRSFTTPAASFCDKMVQRTLLQAVL